MSTLAATFEDIVCADDDNAIYVLRGLLKYRDLSLIYNEGAGLIDSITSAKCPVSAFLTDAERRQLSLLKLKAQDQ